MTIALRRFLQCRAVATLLLCPATCCAVDASTEAARGRRLFDGTETVVARLPGHGTPLPPGLGACVQCHSGAASTNLEARLAPRLNRVMLLEWRRRRGGPMSAYNQDSFCRALRTGSDAADVMLARPMPRFEIDGAQCAALWTYLTEDEENRDETQ